MMKECVAWQTARDVLLGVFARSVTDRGTSGKPDAQHSSDTVALPLSGCKLKCNLLSRIATRYEKGTLHFLRCKVPVYANCSPQSFSSVT